MKKNHKTILLTSIGVLGGVVAYEVGKNAVSNYFYDMVIKKHPDKIPVDQWDERYYSKEFKQRSLQKLAENEAWLATHSYHDRWITSFDGLRLHAYLFEAAHPSHRWLIACHGWSGDGLFMANLPVTLHELGYNTLLVDCRGHGQSDGDYVSMGYYDKFDLKAWCEYIVQQDPLARIALYGISMGAASVLMCSDLDLPSNVKAMVEDCGYTSIRDIFAYQLRTQYPIPLPDEPILHNFDEVLRKRANYSLYDGSVLEHVARSTIPTLFIHGEKDTFVPYEMGKKLFEAANCPKEFASFPMANHGGSCLEDAYYPTLLGFFAKYL